jgi:hypothetical protein
MVPSLALKVKSLWLPPVRVEPSPEAAVKAPPLVEVKVSEKSPSTTEAVVVEPETVWLT